jgi:hypothetical protein
MKLITCSLEKTTCSKNMNGCKHANGSVKTRLMNQNVDTWITILLQIHHTGTMKTAMKSQNVDTWITLLIAKDSGTMKTAMKSQIVASGISIGNHMVVKEFVRDI